MQILNRLAAGMCQKDTSQKKKKKKTMKHVVATGQRFDLSDIHTHTDGAMTKFAMMMVIKNEAIDSGKRCEAHTFSTQSFGLMMCV